MPRKHPITVRVEEAIARHREWERPLTFESLRTYVMHNLRVMDYSADEAMQAIVDKHIRVYLRRPDLTINDATALTYENTEDCTVEEFEEQVRVKRENQTYVARRLRADEAVLEFLQEKQRMLSRPVTVAEFASEIEEIYAEYAAGGGEEAAA